MAVKQGLATVRQRIAAVTKEAGCEEPCLVAVSKLMEIPTLMEAYNEGQRHFGENYVQEFCDKAPQMPQDIKWHFIGHLQSNKAKNLIKAVPNLYVVESVDSAKTATALNKACDSVGRQDLLNVMVQVNTSSEESKSGCEPSEAPAVVQHIMRDCTKLKFTGLMTIGKLGDPNPEPYFKLLSEIREKLVAELGLKDKVLLSMGMSGDYELAIRSGSNSVRVGSSIFGARPPKPSSPRGGGKGDVPSEKKPEAPAAASSVSASASEAGGLGSMFGGGIVTGVAIAAIAVGAFMILRPR